jgi:hypothetical protein
LTDIVGVRCHKFVSPEGLRPTAIGEVPTIVLCYEAVEADIQGADLTSRGISTHGRVLKDNLDYFGAVCGRAGYAFDRALT